MPYPQHIGALIPGLHQRQEPWLAMVERRCRVSDIGERAFAFALTEQPQC